jgi:hypothetical protein
MFPRAEEAITRVARVRRTECTLRVVGTGRRSFVVAAAVTVAATTVSLPAGAPNGPHPAQAADLGKLLDQERARLQDIIRQDGGGHDPI